MSLTEDELALLRFTCDLFFADESPLHFLDVDGREPDDYASAYGTLVDKGVIDPHGFRITDDALNRIAPVTECDGRVVLVSQSPDGDIEQSDFYLLDEISVPFFQGEGIHAFGVDMDHEEFLEYLAKRFVPRRASGDMVALQLTTLEFAAFAMLTRRRDDAGNVDLTLDEVRTCLGRAPVKDALTAASSGLLAVMNMRQPESTGTSKRRLHKDTRWNDALTALIEKGIFSYSDERLVLRRSLVDMAESMSRAERHTFVRYDFGEDEWLLRETTLVPTDGGLFLIRTAGPGEIAIEELDGDGLKSALARAVGPLPSSDPGKRKRSFPELFIVDDDINSATQADDSSPFQRDDATATATDTEVTPDHPGQS